MSMKDDGSSGDRCFHQKDVEVGRSFTLLFLWTS